MFIKIKIMHNFLYLDKPYGQRYIFGAWLKKRTVWFWCQSTLAVAKKVFECFGDHYVLTVEVVIIMLRINYVRLSNITISWDQTRLRRGENKSSGNQVVNLYGNLLELSSKRYYFFSTGLMSIRGSGYSNRRTSYFLRWYINNFLGGLAPYS